MISHLSGNSKNKTNWEQVAKIFFINSINTTTMSGCHVNENEPVCWYDLVKVYVEELL